MVNAYRLRVRAFTLNPDAFDGALIPASCRRATGAWDWALVFMWICPELTRDEADACAEYASAANMTTALASFKHVIGDLADGSLRRPKRQT